DGGLTHERGWFKWALLVLLCLLSSLNQALCFSYAPVSRLAELSWQHQIRSTTLITIYFVVFIPFAFVGSWILDKKGCCFGFFLGATLQAVGATLRDISARFDIPMEQERAILVIGQVLAAMAMPFMVNSPPMLAVQWFPSSIRSRVISIGVNSNHLGVAFVYLVAPFYVSKKEDIAHWNRVLAFMTIVLMVSAFICFWIARSAPRANFSTESYNWSQWLLAFQSKGFILTVLVFSVTETAINVLCAMLSHLLSLHEGFSKVLQGLMGATFVFSTILGGHFIGHSVDITASHKKAVVMCCFISGIMLIGFEFILIKHVSWHIIGATSSLIIIGFFLGPLQALTLELGAQSSYPTSEATVAALQQLCGNFLSAASVPLLSFIQHTRESRANAHVTKTNSTISPHRTHPNLILLKWWDFFSAPESVVALSLILSESNVYGTFEENDTMAGSPDKRGNIKWIMVTLLSLLSCLNQAICYSYAPIAKIAEESWDYGVQTTTLITIYFIVYIPFAFIGSWVMDYKGLRFGVLVGALLQASGATLRFIASSGHVDKIWEVLFLICGQTLAAMAMPFMVNSPPMLSALWFPPSQRAAATSIAVNCNQLGIAFVYIITPFLVLGPEDVPRWSGIIALISILTAALACCFFQRSPHFISTSSSFDWKQWRDAFNHEGFSLTILVFSIAETVINVLSSMLNHILNSAGFSKKQEGLIGAAFIVSSLFGGQCLSAYVDVTKAHKKALMGCLFITATSLTLFQTVLAFPAIPHHVVWTLVCLMIAGLFLGPLQPISLELGVECAHPTTEATVAALQQLCGNFLSALVVPLLSFLSHVHEPSSSSDEFSWFTELTSPESVLAIALYISALAFCQFKGKFKRFAKESNSTENIYV
ncbi:Major facilitator Superfamily, partial [Thraustotheca clavata]